jgi:hypothetical protein
MIWTAISFALVAKAQIFSAAPAAAGTQLDLNLWISRNVAPTSMIRIQLNTRNLPAVTLTAKRIDGVSWLSRERTAKTPEPDGPAVRSWRTVLGERVRNVVDQYYSRAINMPHLPVGVYVIEARAGGLVKWDVVDVTNLAVVVKRSPRHVLAWVTGFRSHQTVAGATATLSTLRVGGL